MKLHTEGQWLQTNNGGIEFISASSARGTDNVGGYSSVTVAWKLATGPTVETVLRQYNDGKTATFELAFPDGLNGTSVSDAEQLLSAFPVLRAVSSATPEDPQGFYQYSGSGVPADGCTWGKWPAERLETGFDKASGALVIMDQTLRSTLVISPFVGFSTVNLLYANSTLSFGLEGAISSIPAGYRYSIVAHLDDGFNNAMMKWGDILLRKSGKPRDTWQSDFSLNKYAQLALVGGCEQSIGQFGRRHLASPMSIVSTRALHC